MANPSSISKESLSGSTNGMPIKVHATATLGTAIHTAKAGTTTNEFDEVWLWAFSHSTITELLTIEFGGVAVPDNIIEVSIPAKSGLILVVPGLILQNTKAITAFAAHADLVVIAGFVNRISS